MAKIDIVEFRAHASIAREQDIHREISNMDLSNTHVHALEFSLYYSDCVWYICMSLCFLLF